MPMIEVVERHWVPEFPDIEWPACAAACRARAVTWRDTVSWVPATYECMGRAL